MGIRSLEDRLVLLDSIVKAGCMYGVEIWGWAKWEALERVQGRFVKMALGINNNTPNYIWEMEAGRHQLGVEGFRRAGRYLLDIGRMEEGRWPRECLKEELRGLKNRKGTKWGDKVVERFKEVGDGESMNMVLVEEDRERLEGFLKRGVKIMREQGVQKNWNRIEKSRYCKDYGEWKKEVGREKYWEGKVGNAEVREQ